MSAPKVVVAPVRPPPSKRDNSALHGLRIHPHSVTGWFANWRVAMVVATQLVFFGVPWLQWEGRQAVLFDLVARQFYLGPLVLYPQDFIYLTGLLITSALGLFVFTAVAGRLWCGYTCPQTVYTEIFLWIERAIEGDGPRQRRLDGAPLGPRKIAIRGTKHLVWVLFALWTGFTFAGFFVPIRVMTAGIPTLDFGAEAIAILFYGFFTYYNAGWLREKICKFMCPYARFQSVMFDADTLIVTYDAARGEPRGTRRKGENEGLGSCVDCGFCVSVCPTGIDIRNGLQIDCIACGACIDACDQVMDRMQLPRGLIRYTTENVLAGKRAPGRWYTHVLRPRVIGYGLVMAAVVGVMLATLLTRDPFRVNVMREGSVLSRPTADGRVENLYRIKVFNMDEQPRRYRISAEGLPSLDMASMEGAEFDVPAIGHRTLAVYLRIDPEQVEPGSHDVSFTVETRDGGRSLTVVERSTFLLR
ncbi:MAG: cytochrome c oxidase accessory protein CcoG [Burkholderiales bacterium]|nr:cytochrome c oxidase accessory protein CcoG [Burkholderiales bacterium]